MDSIKLDIDSKQLYEIMYKTMERAGCKLPRDVVTALNNAKESEDNDIARLHIDTTLENLEMAERESRLACCDTGYPLYYIKIGENVNVIEGISSIYNTANRAVAQLTQDAKLRPTMVHPLYRINPGNNSGYYIPKVEVRFDRSVDGIEITAVPKGGGSEIFGTFYKMMAPADGMDGIVKFVLEKTTHALHAGKVCPPVVLGIGIGGTSDICMKIAKEAAVLRVIGERHPEADISKLELKLMNSINSLGIGPMGFKGINAVLDVHVEYAYTHTASLPVAINCQCSICRRSTAKIDGAGTVTYGMENPGWHYR